MLHRLSGGVGALIVLFAVFGLGRLLAGNDLTTREGFLEQLFADVRTE